MYFNSWFWTLLPLKRVCFYSSRQFTWLDSHSKLPCSVQHPRISCNFPATAFQGLLAHAVQVSAKDLGKSIYTDLRAPPSVAGYAFSLLSWSGTLHFCPMPFQARRSLAFCLSSSHSSPHELGHSLSEKLSSLCLLLLNPLPSNNFFCTVLLS